MTLSRRCLNNLPRLRWIVLAAALVVCGLISGCAGGSGMARPPEFNPVVPGWGPMIAVFPIENLSGAPAPLKDLHEELTEILQRAGARIVDNAAVEGFIDRHWVRYVGGVDEKTASELRDETGADAVLITSLELYNDQDTPRIGLMARLVSVDGVPEIIWMDDFAKAGEDAPGLLALGIIKDPVRLRKLALEHLEKSLQDYITNPPVRPQMISAQQLREEKPFTLSTLVEKMKQEPNLLSGRAAVKRPWYSPVGGLLPSRYNPKKWYSSGDILDQQLRSIAIIPFQNLSTRKRGAEILALYLAKQLVRDGRFKVLDLGVIRDMMLNLRIIMSDGVSNANIDNIANSMAVDLFINGKLFDYLESNMPGQTPKVAFSLQMYERDTRKILWNSRSGNKGDDGVFFFDYGQISTASALTDKMTRSLINSLLDSVAGK